jgi:hypothetical protein
MNSIEEKLWNYIDGTCSPQEHEHISQLILHDEEYKQQYAELMQLHNEFSNTGTGRAANGFYIQRNGADPYPGGQRTFKSGY